MKASLPGRRGDVGKEAVTAFRRSGGSRAQPVYALKMFVNSYADWEMPEQ
ncbi:MAG: hypothetical protein QOI78_5164 [Actinomycetota bacterium]|jgi:hypothetical protein|nr:hypothetical protein [Actinomycetota bacterium]